MKASFVRIAAAVGSIVVVLSCDAGPSSPKFGNGIAGGTSGTAPVTPPNPSAPDTNRPFVRIDTPTTNGQLLNVGDSVLVVTRVIDDRQIASLTLQGMKYSGTASLGTLVETIRYPVVTVPSGSQLALRTGLTDTIFQRYLKPAVPIDSTVDSLVIFAIARDGVGNVDTARRRMDIVTGPSVTITAPTAGDSVSQNVSMLVSAVVTHNSGVRDVTVRVQGEPTWPATALLDTTIITTMVGTQRTVNVSHTIPIALTAPVRGRITITVSARDLNGNPGSAPPIVVFVRQFGTTTPRVTQEIPTRLEIADSITIIATGDGIALVGFTMVDENLVLVKDTNVALTPPFTSNARVSIGINLPAAQQGRRMRISSYATDQAGVTGYSVSATSAGFQTNPANALRDTTLIVFGRTYKLPRPGVVGDLVVDTVRSHVLLSNMDNNRLEVWQNTLKAFDPLGVAVGSLPWGLNVSLNPDTLLVANSGGTNISQVFLGDRVTGDPRTIQEDLARRIRTRTNFLYVVGEGLDASGSVKISVAPPRMFSDRPQYIGQISNGTIFFSTRPTTTAPEGTVRYLNPSQPFPDLRTFVFVRSLGSAVSNFVLVDYDSAVVHPAGVNTPDTIYVFDHIPGTNLPSNVVKTPTCSNGVVVPGITACSGPGDPRFDARFPNGLPQGTAAADSAMKIVLGSCSPACSDGYYFRNVEPVGITDTTFVALSADRNWIAFGEGNLNPGIMMMASAVPSFFSPLITQFDLTNQASERIFGLAIDSTGLTVAAHGSQSYYSSVDVPFHLRLQGIFAAAGTGGAGIAYHPRANGTASPADERLSFVAAGDKTVNAVDIAYFISRGRYELKNQLYGPLRVSRRMAGDDPTIILKLYGIALEGLVVIELRAADILPVP